MAQTNSGEIVLLRVWGNPVVSGSWRQQLIITDQAVYGEILNNFKRLKMTLPYDRIAQVSLAISSAIETLSSALSRRTTRGSIDALFN